MGKARGKYVFNEELKKQFKYMIKNNSESDLKCTICGANINIASDGKTGIERHAQSTKHKKAVAARGASHRLTKFYSAPAQDKTMTIREGVWAYHTVQSNHSFKSADCATKIFQTCYEMPKFRCARTKCEAIITNVIAPYAQRLVDDEMTEVSYVTVLTDASNKGSTKMFPVLVRYFVPTEGVRIKIADFCTTKGETSEIISELIKTTAKNRNFAEKVVAFCADNCPTNFGSKQRGGQNNVFFRLKLWIPALLGIGCAAHITHSALKSACDELPIDIELVVVKIYSHFYIYTVRVEKLKNICEMEGVEYKKLLGYAKTRFLALGPAIARILELFDPLKTYFLKVKGETFLKKFFNDSMSKLWLVFVKEQAEAFKETVLSIEGENICAPDVAFQLEQLRASIILRKDENYFSPTMESEIQALHDSGEFSEKSFNAASSCFYGNKAY